MHKIDTPTIKAYALNRWPEILLNLAPHLSPMIERGRKHGPCPLCGGKDRARCHNDFDATGGTFCNQCRGGWDGIKTLEWANGWSFKQTVDAISSHLGLADGAIPTIKPIPKPAPGPEKDWSAERQKVNSIWNETIQDEGRVHEYFENRGLSTIIPSCLRFHPNLEYFDNGPKYPAMVAPIIRDGKTVGIHRTYLDKNGPGKAPVLPQRKYLKCADTINGGSIQLFDAEPGSPLAVGEGIETMMAVFELTGFSVWSAADAGMLEKIIIPDSVSEVVICGDLDKEGRGQQATERLAERLHAEGKQVKIALPPGPIPEGSKSVDWLDVLNESEVAYV